MYPEAAEEDASLARYTSARIGGRADILLRARTSEDLIKFATWLWEHDQSFEILGGGSNVLIPGTIGGALVGNAGAHGGDISQVLVMAEILHIDNGRMRLDSDDLNFAYRTSDLKRMAKKAVVLSAEFKLHTNSKKDIQERMYANLGHRKLTQPPGASMGSMFKNPENDFAGRLIESVGLKGFQMGNAQISPLHGNFFLNKGDAKASEVYALISEAQARVQEKLGIHLELEIGLLGDWTDQK
jgi:UDP-N-acetylmuramate dehydrogenase